MGDNRKVFEPIEINGMKLKNRIAFAPMLNMPRDADWGPNDNTALWFEERAKGGAGLIMTGTFLPLHPTLPDGPERFAKLADTVHEYGAKFGVQIGLGGPMGGSGPSEPPYPDEKHPKQSIFEYFTGNISPMPWVDEITELRVDEIEDNIEAVAVAAKALKDCGVDCVELHCAHGGATFFCSMISPFYNRREDDYGGSWENRLRAPVAAIKKMREAVGDDFPLFARISADELLGDAGITLEDTVKIIAPALEKAGLDCIDVSQGSILHSPEGITIPLYYPRGCYIHNAEAVKKAVTIPVIGVGRIVEMDMAEKFLQEDKADIIYMGRQLTSDPETVNKYSEGRPEDVRICIGCLEGCGTPCPINYDITPDAIPLTRAEKTKNILVVGGGVAGMEAARVCALRGHDVTLMEKSSALGGTVAALALDPLAAEFGSFVTYLGVQMRKLGVDVRVCREADEAAIKELNPDAVILAAGASSVTPEVAADKPAVMGHLEALRNRAAIGQRVVIWGLVYGAELAVSLAEEGKDVCLVGGRGETALASHAADTRRWWIIRKLVDFSPVRAYPEALKLDNPRILYHSQIEAVTPEGISVTNKQGDKSVLPYDTLIVSRGRQKNDSLFDQLEGKTSEIHKIGDCAAMGNILAAVRSANEVARKI
jgi:2,4-dienoyl-CoA reductase-like NADH-dependent reductase (Old Yellow Enzyme family)/thioredoxin reductase